MKVANGEEIDELVEELEGGGAERDEIADEEEDE